MMPVSYCYSDCQQLLNKWHGLLAMFKLIIDDFFYFKFPSSEFRDDSQRKNIQNKIFAIFSSYIVVIGNDLRYPAVIGAVIILFYFELPVILFSLDLG